VTPWAESASPRFTLFEQLFEELASTNNPLSVSVHSNRIHRERLTWERHAFGYR
jgi:hypothetical protein